MYRVSTILEKYKHKLKQYLEADYHIWNDSLIRQRSEIFEEAGVISNEPYIEATPRYKDGKSLSQLRLPKNAMLLLEALAKIPTSGVFSQLRQHQCEALESFLSDDEEIIVSTGTGSGKTESFLYPIMGSLAMEASRGTEVVEAPGVRVLLLYPMNALVNDQLGRLRRMFGSDAVSQEIKKHRGRQATFGVYTSRTDYPGERQDSRDIQLKEKFKKLYLGSNESHRIKLEEEGFWPSKNLSKFIKSEFRTDKDDAELLTRHEMQETPPDILVTNYSMLEYMLARPIERPIFEKTAEWLEMSDENYLTIVLDEAHMYRGVAGAEVAYLLRRLLGRLRLPRTRVRFILTSASLGSDSDREKVHRFANELTGKQFGSFRVITSVIHKFDNAAKASVDQTIALSNLRADIFDDAINSPEGMVQEFSSFFQAIGLGSIKPGAYSLEELRNEIYRKIERFSVACLLANTVTTRSVPYAELVNILFPKSDHSNQALETLLSLVTFAMQAKPTQVFLPLRLHLMYRGIPGLYGCINTSCSRSVANESRLFGSLYLSPEITCVCGGRVFEILTHRSCGAAFIRGYYDPSKEDFLLHKQSAELSDKKLREAHFLLMEGSRLSTGSVRRLFIDVFTGKLFKTAQNSVSTRELISSTEREVSLFSGPTWSFKSCPVCARRCVSDGRSKIQDLATKGEAPFAYLVREQVNLQPASRSPDTRYPLAGRKSLVFSDGRQKAARLARDLPSAIGKDIFRVCLFRAISYLNRLYRSDQTKNMRKRIGLDALYVAFLMTLRKENLRLFNDHPDSDIEVSHGLARLNQKITDFPSLYASDFDESSIEDFELLLEIGQQKIPPAFSSLILLNLSNEFYSLQALLLAVLWPSPAELRLFTERISQLGLTETDAVQISHNWLTAVVMKGYSYNKDFNNSERRSAAGHPQDWGYLPPKAGLGTSKFFRKLSFMDSTVAGQVERLLLDIFCQSNNGRYFVSPFAIYLKPVATDVWYQCHECTRLFHTPIRGICPHSACQSMKHESLDPSKSNYLRTRKSFFRDPVLASVAGDTKLFNFNVQEHSAQLSHRDNETILSTSERYERLFKDFLLDKTDRPIDVLSCTTTMEVGVDIGSLIAVAMRNVPPARQNYQQRAGRAGRRGSAVSTVITYAQMGSHDSHYFDNPSEIFSGSPVVPEIDLYNEKILSRHIYASVIQSFFHRLGITVSYRNDLLKVLGTTKDFYEKTDDFSFKAFSEYLDSEFLGSIDAYEIRKWIPQGFTSLESATKTLKEILQKERPQDLTMAGEFEEEFLEFLSECDLLPTYAFPRNMVEFRIESRGSRFEDPTIKERPKQGLATALTEYAPGRTTVVDKKKYLIGTIAARCSEQNESRALKLFEKKRKYFQCGACYFTESAKSERQSGEQCEHCFSDNTEVIDVLQPEVVYPESRKPIDSMTDDEEDTYTQATSAQLPFVGSEDNSDLKVFKERTFFASRLNQELVMLNRGICESGRYIGFWVCQRCGKATPDANMPQGPTHHPDYFVFGKDDDYRCSGQFAKINLGYTFNSDIFLMRIPIASPLLQETSGFSSHALLSAARTLAEAFLKEACLTLEIEPNELSCGVRLLRIQNVINLDIFIFDTAAGGAGYAKLVGTQLNSIFSGLSRHLKSSCCQLSCYRCLQSYSNRFHHSHLNKQLGLQLWCYINDGTIPEVQDLENQLNIAAPLLQLFKLEGFSRVEDEAKIIRLKSGDKTVRFVIYPVLLDTNFVRLSYSSDISLISDFEITHSISSAFAALNR